MNWSSTDISPDIILRNSKDKMISYVTHMNINDNNPKVSELLSYNDENGFRSMVLLNHSIDFNDDIDKDDDSNSNFNVFRYIFRVDAIPIKKKMLSNNPNWYYK